ncbi:MAG: zf-HC2 domain-containing protein [Gemmatimonadetes bacterium]|nr:zf-HC2 domain-containing protein [Gemmatimonadota bacterium]
MNAKSEVGMSASEMRCRTALELLHEYVDGELPAPLAARVDAHLGSCPGCPKKLELELAFREVLRRQRERRHLPGGLLERILAALGRDAVPRGLNIWR